MLQTRRKMVEVSQRSSQAILCHDTGLVTLNHGAFGITRVRPRTHLRPDHVGFLSIQEESRQFCRLAEADGQQSAGERIQAAGMAGLAGVEQPFHPLQSTI